MKLVSWSVICLLFVGAIVFAAPYNFIRHIIPAIEGVLYEHGSPDKSERSETAPSDDLAPQGNQFFNGDAWDLSDDKWSTSAGGPFTEPFVSGNVMNFAKVNGFAQGAGAVTIGGMNAIENFRLAFPSGTLSTGGTVVPITVASGKTLDIGNQLLATNAGTGFIKNGGGIFVTSSTSQFPGGFTINDGTIVIGNASSMGGGATNFLNINGGVIATSSSLVLANRFPMGIRVGGDFQLGAKENVVPSLMNASLTFDNAVDLGSADRTITIGSNASFTLGGPISGSPQVGLTIACAPGTAGILRFQSANTYTGNTIIRGALSLAGSGSIANSSLIDVAGTGIFDVKGLTTPLTLANGQTLRASGSTTAGVIVTNSSRGLSTAANTRIEFAAFNGMVAPLAVSGAGILSLQSGNSVVVTVASGGNPLGVGDYKLISKVTTGSVIGLPATVTVDGDGVVGTPSLVLNSGELYLRVSADTTPPPSPNISGSNPASPSASITPNILGTSEANSLVRIYRSSDCSGSQVASQQLSGGSSAFSVAVTVNANTTTVFSATATDASNNTSSCSNAFEYQHVPPKDTTPPTVTYLPLSDLETSADQNLMVIATDDSPTLTVTLRFESDGGQSSTTDIACSLTAAANTYICVIPAALLPSVGAVSYYVSVIDPADNETSVPAGASPVPGAPGPRNMFTVGSGGSIDTSLINVFDHLRVGSNFNITNNSTVTNMISLAGDLSLGSNTLTLACSAHISGAGENAYIQGSLKKEFCGPETFTFPVGTVRNNVLAVQRAPKGAPSEYSPFTTQVTAVTGNSSLTVTANDGVMEGMYSGQAVSRWWDVAETGDITADISFTWLDQDVAGNEPAFNVIRRSTFSEGYAGGMVNADTNTATAANVTEFSGWSAGFLMPTAASVGMSGVVTAGGHGLPNAIVKLTAMNGTVVATARTSAFGYYTIEGLTSGESYIVTITSKRFTFPPRVITLPFTQVGVDFTAEP